MTPEKARATKTATLPPYLATLGLKTRGAALQDRAPAQPPRDEWLLNAGAQPTYAMATTMPFIIPELMRDIHNHRDLLRKWEAYFFKDMQRIARKRKPVSGKQAAKIREIHGALIARYEATRNSSENAS